MSFEESLSAENPFEESTTKPLRVVSNQEGIEVARFASDADEAQTILDELRQHGPEDVEWRIEGNPDYQESRKAA